MPPTQIVKVSIPTKNQFVHGVERALLIFVTVSVGFWLKTNMPFSTSAAWGAVLAGATAVYQLILSSLTTL